MCVYIYTYIYTYINKYVHTYIHTYIHTYMHTYIHIKTDEDLVLGGDACLVLVRHLPQFDGLVVGGEDLPKKKKTQKLVYSDYGGFAGLAQCPVAFGFRV
jgi:hypothetical protein